MQTAEAFQHALNSQFLKLTEEFGLVTTSLRFPFYACLIRRFPSNDDWIGEVSGSSCSTVFQFNDAGKAAEEAGHPPPPLPKVSFSTFMFLAVPLS